MRTVDTETSLAALAVNHDSAAAWPCNEPANIARCSTTKPSCGGKAYTSLNSGAAMQLWLIR